MAKKKTKYKKQPYRNAAPAPRAFTPRAPRAAKPEDETSLRRLGYTAAGAAGTVVPGAQEGVGIGRAVGERKDFRGTAGQRLRFGGLLKNQRQQAGQHGRAADQQRRSDAFAGDLGHGAGTPCAGRLG